MTAASRERPGSSQAQYHDQQRRRPSPSRSPNEQVDNTYNQNPSSLNVPQSPYPPSTGGRTSPRQRAHTFANTNTLQPNSPYSYNMHTPYRPGHGQQLPPPPPQNVPSQTMGMPIPPPPPRPVVQQHQLMIPPPPSNPPSAHPTYWNRQQSYPPPPNTATTPAPYNPGAYHQQLQQPQQQQSESLVSATYIPGSDGWGPGVGIPPLYPLQDYDTGSAYPTGSSTYNNQLVNQAQISTPVDNSRRWQESQTYQSFQNQNIHRAPSSRNIQVPQGYASPGPPTATLNNPQHPSPREQPRQPDIQAARTPISPSDPGLQWPMDRVLLWLASQGFSKDWQEAFEALDLHGNQFLDIGRGHGTRGNVAMMHSLIYPRMAQQQGKNWDQIRDREEGKRLRKLVRKIVDIGAAGGSLAPHRREPSITSAGTDGGVETSPNMGPGISSTPTTAGGTGDDSPGLYGPPTGQSPASAGWNKRSSGQRLGDYVNENGRSQWSQDALRNAGDGFAKHSRNTSREYLSDHGRESARHASPQHSPGIKSAQPMNGAQTPGGRYYNGQGHLREASSESAAAGRRNAQEGPRPPTLEVAGRSHSQETPVSAKEHKGIFSRLKRKEKRDGHASPDGDESPTSPVNLRQLAMGGLGRSGLNASDVSLNRPRSRSSLAIEEERTLTRNAVPAGARKFCMVTFDGWNYRLVDITAVNSAAGLRKLILENLGASHANNATFHLTSLGQTEHDEALSDELLMFARKSMSDNLGTLKIFANIPQEVMPAGLGIAGVISPVGRMSVTGKPISEALLARLKTDAPPDSASPNSAEQTLVSQKGESLTKLISPQETRHATQRQWDVSGEVGNYSEADRRRILEAAAEQHRHQNERKQKAYLESRKAQIQQSRPGDKDGPSIRGRSVDFDKERPSPFADQTPFEARHGSQRSRELVAHRPPPPVPPESNTLTKVNSLTKKNSGHRPRRSDGEDYKRRSAEETILENAESGRPRTSAGSSSTKSAIRDSASSSGTFNSASTPGSSFSQAGSDGSFKRAMQTVNFNDSGRNTPGGSPRSPGQLTMSKGNIPFMIPDYESDVEDLSLNTGSNGSGIKPALTLITNPALDRVKGGEQKRAASPDISPSTATPQENGSNGSNLSRMSSRRSYGPNFDFKEAPVQWKTTAIPQADEEDSDSDDSLFAVQIRKDPSRPGSSQGGPDKDERPSLTLKTSKVTFQPTPRSASTDGTESDNKEAASASARTPEDLDSKFLRRQSFASDIWANRPPAEGIVDHLDEFFPNVNLDEPVLEGGVTSPTSPNGLTAEDSQEFAAASGFIPPFTNNRQEESDTLGSDQSTLKRGDTVASIAQRNIRKSGGLGRTKSIREVVQNAYRDPPMTSASFAQPGHSNASPTRVNTLRQSAAAGAIVRRKSTKMFGARIEQIKPRGSRLIQLETIPQESPMMVTSTNHASSAAPQRQPTFKWMKGQLIGKGTFGRVYLGMNMTTGELIAVKQVEVKQASHSNDKEKMKEMVRALDIEIDTMQHLDHPNIVSYLGCERKEYSISIFLEYIPGGSIGSCLRKHGKFEEAIVSSLTRQTLAGLAYLHNEGILHRDLKADNILLDLDGTSKISDFGISKKTDNIYGNDITNSMQGSVFWMAPEVIRSQGQGYSAKVDIWSLGCVVLEMFAGRRPWSKEEAIGAIYKLGSYQAPPIPEEITKTIGPAAFTFMLDCFTIDPAERPTAARLLDHPFAFLSPHYNFLDTDLHGKLKSAGMT
ncbi:Pkinase-domain-containing protein [Tothia fuscella]|uniref:mitogen-activated protein kinase n=1 Tax=Tothia fuscella TaxID=1048955 RepID=A0A9P4NQ28_9PEZI|nr:Pkinase-domain-containing protein [Tothia fuscella]